MDLVFIVIFETEYSTVSLRNIVWDYASDGQRKTCNLLVCARKYRVEKLMDVLQRFTHGEIDAFEMLVRQFQGDIYAWTTADRYQPGGRPSASQPARLAICLVRSRGKWHRSPASHLMLLDFAQHRLDVDDRRAVDGFQGTDPQTVLGDPANRDSMKADRIRAIGRAGRKHSSKPSLRV
jgi:hypothetical protein